MGMPVNEGAAKAIKDVFEERLPGYERILSKQKYLAGDDLTLVDLFHLPHGQLVVDVRRLPPSLRPALTDVRYPEQRHTIVH